MKLFRIVKNRSRQVRQLQAQRTLLRRFSGVAEEITREQWPESLRDPTAFYERCFHYFHSRLPEPLREHRNYFESNGRGFGEKPFHVMWFLLFREFAPESFLEIGVFRGQTLSFAALLARYFNFPCVTQGISPFSAAGDAVSIYPRDVDYYNDTNQNFARFSLPVPSLLKAFSTDEAAAKLISSREWSCVYIDGNHDYDVARRDWDLCAAHLKNTGVIVLDDSALTTSYAPPIFATGGHPGPSRLALEIEREKFTEILQVGHNRVFQKTGH